VTKCAHLSKTVFYIISSSSVLCVPYLEVRCRHQRQDLQTRHPTKVLPTHKGIISCVAEVLRIRTSRLSAKNEIRWRKLNLRFTVSCHRPAENRVLRRIFRPKRDEVTGERRQLHNEELTDLYSSPSIVRVIKSRRMRRAGNVARMGRAQVYTGFWWGNLGERDD